MVEILRLKLDAAKKRAIPPKKKKPLPVEFGKQAVIAVASIGDQLSFKEYIDPFTGEAAKKK